LSKKEIADRAAQSKRDKARHLQMQARPNGGSKPPSLKAQPKRGVGYDAFMRHMNTVTRGLPAPVPTRLEVFVFRARVTLRAGNLQPSILFHPAVSVSPAVILTPGVTANPGIWSLTRSQETDTGTLGDWVDSDVTPLGSVPDGVYNSGAVAAEAIGHPKNLVSAEGRATGGVMRIKVTGGPTLRGYLAHSCPQADFDPATQKAEHASNATIPRLELKDGLQHDFYAPLMIPHAMEDFKGAIDRFHWSTTDPFGGMLLTLHDVAFAADYDRPPVMDVLMYHAVECRLDLADRHLQTPHSSQTKEEKTRVQGGTTGHGSTTLPPPRTPGWFTGGGPR